MADETGRREFEITTNPDRTLHSANDDARDIPREAAALVTTKPGDRRCTGKVKLRPDMRKPAGPDNEYFRNEDGSIKTRPCRNHPIKGGWVCEKHGGSIKVVRNRANKRLLAMAEPALIRLNELAHQSTHLPTALQDQAAPRLPLTDQPSPIRLHHRRGTERLVLGQPRRRQVRHRAVDVPRAALSYPGYRYAVLRTSFPELIKNHLIYLGPEMKAIWGKDGVGWNASKFIASIRTAAWGSTCRPRPRSRCATRSASR
jgi:hypothetical protein